MKREELNRLIVDYCRLLPIIILPSRLSKKRQTLSTNRFMEQAISPTNDQSIRLALLAKRASNEQIAVRDESAFETSGQSWIFFLFCRCCALMFRFSASSEETDRPSARYIKETLMKPYFLIPIVLASLYAVARAGAPDYADTNAPADDSTPTVAPTGFSPDDDVVQVASQPDGNVVMTKTVYVIVSGRPVRTRSIITIATPTTITVSVTDQDGATVLTTVAVPASSSTSSTDSMKTGTVTTTVPTDTVTVAPDQVNSSSDTTVFVSTVQHTSTVNTITTDSVPSGWTDIASVSSTSTNSSTRTRWIGTRTRGSHTHTTPTTSSSNGTTSTTSAFPRWRIITYTKPTTTTLLSTTTGTETTTSTVTTISISSVLPTNTAEVQPTSSLPSSVPLLTDQPVITVSVGPDGLSTTDTLYPVDSTVMVEPTSSTVMTTVGPDGFITILTVAPDALSSQVLFSTSSRNVDVCTVTRGRSRRIFTLPSWSWDRPTKTQTIIRYGRLRTTTAIVPTSVEVTTTVVLESPVIVVSTVLKAFPVTLTRTALREHTRLLAPRAVTRISTATYYSRRNVTRYSAWPTTTTTTQLATTTQTRLVAPMTYIRSLPQQTVTELEYRTATITNYVPSIVRAPPLTRTETLALVRMATETITAASGGATVVTRTVPGTQIAIPIATCIPPAAFNITERIKSRADHAALCHQARLDLLAKLTANCQSGSINADQLLAELPPSSDLPIDTDQDNELNDFGIGEHDNVKSSSDCFAELLKARDEIDVQQQRQMLGHLYHRYCTYEAMASASVSASSASNISSVQPKNACCKQQSVTATNADPIYGLYRQQQACSQSAPTSTDASANSMTAITKNGTSSISAMQVMYVNQPQ